MIVGIGSQNFNSLKVADKELQKSKLEEEIILSFGEDYHLSHIIDIIEKHPPNQQFWLILWNWHNISHIQAMINYSETKQSSNHIRLFVLYDSLQAYTKIQ